MSSKFDTSITHSAIVTTGRKYNAAAEELARKVAAELGFPFVVRGRASIPELIKENGVSFALIAKKGLLVLHTPAGELFFHPNMAHLRLKNLRFGEGVDHMTEAMGLKEGMSVLDCTLGFGSDAIVASYMVGASGSVTGIESSKLVAAVTGYGLANAIGDNYPMQEAMRRIRVINADALDFLRKAKEDSYDVVYFDPMFRHPLLDSVGLAPLRPVADCRPLTAETVKEACRVAKSRVVLKENAKSGEFERLGFSSFVGGKYSKVRYGVISG